MREEDAIQTAVVAYLDLVLIPPAFCVHVANNPRSKVDGPRLKRLGLRKGFPDLLVFTPEKIIALEVKAEKGTVSPEQMVMHSNLRMNHVDIAVVRSVDETEKVLKWFGIETRAR